MELETFIRETLKSLGISVEAWEKLPVNVRKSLTGCIEDIKILDFSIRKIAMDFQESDVVMLKWRKQEERKVVEMSEEINSLQDRLRDTFKVEVGEDAFIKE